MDPRPPAPGVQGRHPGARQQGVQDGEPTPSGQGGWRRRMPGRCAVGGSGRRRSAGWYWGAAVATAQTAPGLIRRPAAPRQGARVGRGQRVRLRVLCPVFQPVVAADIVPEPARQPRPRGGEWSCSFIRACWSSLSAVRDRHAQAAVSARQRRSISAFPGKCCHSQRPVLLRPSP